MINDEDDDQVKANLLGQVTNILSVTKSKAGKISKFKVFLSELLFWTKIMMMNYRELIYHLFV